MSTSFPFLISVNGAESAEKGKPPLIRAQINITRDGPDIKQAGHSFPLALGRIHNIRISCLEKPDGLPFCLPDIRQDTEFDARPDTKYERRPAGYPVQSERSRKFEFARALD